VVPPAPPNAADLARIENLVAPALREGLTLVAANALAQASERALETGPSGRPAPWAGDGLSGAITPQPLRRMAKSAQCRTYIQSQGTKTAEAVACKTPGGTWAMVAPKSGR
jgi:surface antigen